MANWVDLPWDLLERISNLCIIHDQIRMQYVCKSWSSILKKNTSRELPWLMMLPNNKEGEDPDARDFFSLSKQKIHTFHLPEIRGRRCCMSFQNGWLMIVDKKLDTFLFHPFLKRRRIDLPHLSTLKHKRFSAMDILKAAVSDDGKVVVIVYGLGFLAFCRVGDDAYTEIDKKNAAIEVVIYPIKDLIYHKCKFYLLTGIHSIYLLNLEEKEDGSPPHIEKLTVNLEADLGEPYTFFGYFGYLVPDILTDSMFVIVTDVHCDGDYANQEEANLPHKTNRLEVFSVTLEDGSHDKSLKRFKKVESLGDRVLFVGHNSPIVVMASQFPGFKGNRIYFTDNMEERYYYSSHGCCDLGVFSLEDGTVEELFADRFHPTTSPPLWIATPPYSSS